MSEKMCLQQKIQLMLVPAVINLCQNKLLFGDSKLSFHISEV